MKPREERGFVLIAVLWLTVGMGILVVVSARAARQAVATAANRVSYARALRKAEGCAAHLLALAERRVNSVTLKDHTAWNRLDRVVLQSGGQTLGCRVAITPGGIRLNVNRASGGEVRRLLYAAGVRQSADALVDALLDWRDADSVPRAAGAEVAWYRRHDRALPRNGPFLAPEEIGLIRGFEHLPVKQWFDIAPAPLYVARAPLPVLASLPGMTAEALSLIREWRARGIATFTWTDLVDHLSRNAADSLTAALPILTPLVTVQPQSWVFTIMGYRGAPPVRARLEITVARVGRRLAIVGKRVD